MDVMKRLILWLLRAPAIVGQPSQTNVEAREFVASGRAARMPLDEFEARFGIHEVDFDSKIDGSPKSRFYRPDDPEDRRRDHEKVEAFLAEG